MQIDEYSWDEFDVKDSEGICLSLSVEWNPQWEEFQVRAREQPSNLRCRYEPPKNMCPMSCENRHTRARLAILNNKCSAKSSLCET